MASRRLTSFSVQRKVRKNIYEAVLEELKKEAPSLEKDIKEDIEDAIEDSDTYRELYDGGNLRGEIGLRPASATSKLTGLKRDIVESVKVTVGSLKGALLSLSRPLKIESDIKGMSVLANKSYGEYEYTSKRLGKKTMKWLRWLLIEGNNIIVKGHSSYETNGQLGRSGEPIKMTVKPDASRSWRVPFQHSGTENDNFITKALETKRTKIEKTFARHVRLAIDRVRIRRRRGRR